MELWGKSNWGCVIKDYSEKLHADEKRIKNVANAIFLLRLW